MCDETPEMAEVLPVTGRRGEPIMAKATHKHMVAVPVYKEFLL